MKPRGLQLLLLSVIVLLPDVRPSIAGPVPMQEAAAEARRKPVLPGNRIDPRRQLFTATDVEFDLKRLASTAVPADVTVLVDRLNADEFEVRTETTGALRRHPMPDEVLMGILVRGGLQEEQRVRLLGILEWRVMNRSRGAVGVRMTQRGFNENPPGIEIAAVIPGLPAERVLKVGDIIQRLDGREALRNEQLILQVQQMRPGERLRVEVLRPIADPPDPEVPGHLVEGDDGRWYEPIEVEIVLGSYEKLNEAPTRDNAETRRRSQLVTRMRGL
ncbi:MAG: PDZ domain-containing protein, partial [Planctomycetota bacterium]|nr:PDZ domain-containing protein [Planctomycetota bacterium]